MKKVSAANGWKKKRQKKAQAIKDDTTYEVEAILNKKYDKDLKSYIYLVKWKSFNHEHNTWEPARSLIEDVPDMIVDYNKKALTMQKK